ncbi:hypothetical protein [uncultured Sphingosinicella sp.]|uniref:hypothetical protein n=1 Tax=uncultured Sphingosinicella sp. TaxID=478748 RepID=UPI0030D900BB|tara:strand:- start:76427 stop:77365 length:939 start_codon:yes stop_codon:yes gene_type:complete
MAAISELPLFTTEYDPAEGLVLPADSSYIYSVTDEPRSAFAEELRARSPAATFVKLNENVPGGFGTDFAGHPTITVRRRATLEAFIAALPKPIHLDMTGLGHSAWAPLARVCLETHTPLRIVYLEPATYSASAHPGIGVIYDLSERIEGIRPIPLFAKLMDRRQNDSCFVPLLGFEGARLLHMMNDVDPAKDKVFPIIGAPGFVPHYPLDTFILNALGLEQDKAIRNLRLAKSNCPFSLFYELEGIARRVPDDLMRIGLIGTKPHALGAVLFSIVHEDRTEIVYDHARRKAGRSKGVAKCLVYAVSEFLDRT